MNVIANAVNVVERAPIPDFVTRMGIAFLVGQTRRRLRRDPVDEAAFAAGMTAFPIAEHVADANTQHYELPPEFFGLVLGPRRKYSCCLYGRSPTTLGEAEERALMESCAHAGLTDGQDVLELGCGWGSLSLWMAAHYPASRIVAVSNSRPQRAYILAAAEQAGLRNLDVVTADMNTFAPQQTFDRIVSIEMFEHMANWRGLLARARMWLRPEGRLFLHVFTHRASPYRFNHHDPADWIAQHFFTGGIMPSHRLIQHFADLFAVEAEWSWSGTHYRRTADDWLRNFDRNRNEITPVLQQVYGALAPVWLRRWRLFFFGHRRFVWSRRRSRMGGQPLSVAPGLSARHERTAFGGFDILRRVWARFQAWRGSDDRLVASAKTIALVVAWNTPFYPFYVWWAAGSNGMPYVWATLCSFPFFLAVPEVARRSPMLGRAMLPIVGVGNSVFCTWLLGADSGTELFNLPCILLGAMLFRPSERWLRLALIGLPIAVLVLLHGRYGSPPYRYSGDQYQGLFTLNLLSVATLTGFLGLMFAPGESGTHQHAG